MRRVSLYGIVAALLPVAALAQNTYHGFQPETGFDFSYGAFGKGGSAPVLNLPLLTNGLPWAESAGTVSHLTWDGVALRESVGGVSWTMNGSVPAVSPLSSPFASSTKGGAGPYSAANSYQGPTTLGEWAGDWSVTVAFVPASFTGGQYLVTKENTTSTAGWGIGTSSSTGTVFLEVYDGALKTATSAQACPVNGICVATVGKSGGTCSAQVGSGAVGTIACGTMTAASAFPLRIGRYEGGGFQFSGTIYEVIASTDAFSSATHLARWQRTVGLEQNGKTLTYARAGTATALVHGINWNVADGAPRIEDGEGLLIERAATDFITNSKVDFSNVAWGKSSATVALPTIGTTNNPAPDGTNTATRITFPAIAGVGQFSVVYQGLASSAAAYNNSVWVKGVSGSGTVYLANTDTTTTYSSTACAYTSTAWTRCNAQATRTVATWYWSLGPDGRAISGQPSTQSSQDVYVWGAQSEQGATMTSYIATPSASRAADVASIATPAGLDPARWSVVGTFQPFGGRSWASGTNYLFSAGTFNAANTFMALAFTDGSLYWRNVNAAGTLKGVWGAHGFTAGTAHSVCLSNSNGTLARRFDGALVTGTAEGGGDGILNAWPTPIRLGTTSGGGVEFDGYLSNFKVFRDARCGK